MNGNIKMQRRKRQLIPRGATTKANQKWTSHTASSKRVSGETKRRENKDVDGKGAERDRSNQRGTGLWPHKIGSGGNAARHKKQSPYRKHRKSPTPSHATTPKVHSQTHTSSLRHHQQSNNNKSLSAPPSRYRNNKCSVSKQMGCRRLPF